MNTIRKPMLPLTAYDSAQAAEAAMRRVQLVLESVDLIISDKLVSAKDGLPSDAAEIVWELVTITRKIVGTHGMPQAKSSKPYVKTPELTEGKRRMIQVARRQLNLADADYRSILAVFGGVDTSTKLDQQGFTAVMARFEALGFKSTSARRPIPARAGMATPAQTAFIRQLWAECTDGAGTDSSLGKWLESRFGVSSVRFVSADIASKVIGGLRHMKRKLAARKVA